MALMKAASNGHLEVAQWLQQAGADIHAKDNVSRALFIASGMRLIACVVGCRWRRDPREVKSGSTSLSWACGGSAQRCRQPRLSCPIAFYFMFLCFLLVRSVA